MQSINIVRQQNIKRSARVSQLEGMFDIPMSKRSAESWTVNLPIDEKPWNIGLIVGPSGCGKTTIINELFSGNIYNEFPWDHEASILDGFPKEMGIKDIAEILNSVGFSSPPSWFKPYHVLSNGEKFRVNVARALAESKDVCVIDEFTSVVDRTVGQIGSFAVSKTVRRQNKKFIAVSCHYDIEEWLQPDWIYKPADNEFQWRSLRRRPEIKLEIVRVHHQAWRLFKQYHYLAQDINKAAHCFVALWDGLPVAFYSYLHFINNRLKRTKRGHRVVCLPDFQGVGIGLRLEEYIASCLKALNWGYIGTSSHPVRNAYCAKSAKWKMIRKPSITKNNAGTGSIEKRMGNYHFRIAATFRYCGPAVGEEEARRILGHD